MNPTMVRTLVVDDSMVFRKILSDLLKEIPGIEIIGHAPNGRIALQKVLTQQPDLLVTALSLPELTGLEVLEEIKAHQIDCGVIMLSDSSPESGTSAARALTAGAFEVLIKPEGETIDESRKLLEYGLKMAVETFKERVRIRRLMAMTPRKPDLQKPQIARPPMPEKFASTPPAFKRVGKCAAGIADLLVIGVSTGGPPALAEIFSQLLQPFAIPVIIVQHIPPFFSEPLAAGLREKSGLCVVEAKEGMLLEPGKIYLSPGGMHLRIVKGSEPVQYKLRLSNDPPENSCRPSIDFLLRSAVNNFVGNIAVLIMTGMGVDGLLGVRLVKESGGYIMAQNGESCVVYGMPKAVIEAGLADEILSLKEIPASMQRVARSASVQGLHVQMPKGDEVMTIKLDRNEVALWMQLVFDLTGISLTEEKEYLIRERMHCLLERYRCTSLSQLYFLARDEHNTELREDIIDQITTKETSFFRDAAPFEALRQHVLPELLKRCRLSPEKRALRIWSAACSTGQEVYSIAMLLHEIGALPSEYRITATDISRYAINVARKGCYSHFEVERGVPPHLLQRFFSPGSGNWQIRDALKESLTFQRLGLHRPFVLPEKFDLIICRNVAIYFSKKERENLFFQLNRHLRSDGYLLIGSTETARDMTTLFMEASLEPRAVFLQPSAR